MTYVATVLADSPAAWFRLADTSGTAMADALGGAAGTYVGGFTLNQPSLVTNDTGAAVRFATNGYGRVASRTAVNPGDTLTVEAWIYLDALPSSGVAAIVDKGANGFILRVETTGVITWRRNNVGNICQSTVRLAARTLYYVAATKRAASEQKIYVNGRDVTGTVTNQTLTTTTTELDIGSADGGAAGNFFNGTIDEVAIYPTSLSAARVLAHYNAGIAAAPITHVVYASGSATATSTAAVTKTSSAAAAASATASATGQAAVTQAVRLAAAATGTATLVVADDGEITVYMGASAAAQAAGVVQVVRQARTSAQASASAGLAASVVAAVRAVAGSQAAAALTPSLIASAVARAAATGSATMRVDRAVGASLVAETIATAALVAAARRSARMSTAAYADAALVVEVLTSHVDPGELHVVILRPSMAVAVEQPSLSIVVDRPALSVEVLP